MNLIQHFQEGGPFMYFILVFGIFSTGLIFERFFSLYRRLPDPAPAFRQSLLDRLAAGDLAGAARVADGATATAIGRIAKLGVELKARAAGDEEVQARMDEALSREIHSVDRRTGFLAMFGNVATLLGLLGTITGMITSFAAVASANPSDRATMLSKGIAEAMNCTAFGLLVAIPALVAYAVFQNRTELFVGKLTALSSEIFHDLLFLAGGAPAPQLRARPAREAASTVVN